MRGYLKVIVYDQIHVTKPGEGAAYFACLPINPAHQPHAVVEKQIAFGLTLTNQKHGILIGLVLVGKPVVVHIVEYIHIMN